MSRTCHATENGWWRWKNLCFVLVIGIGRRERCVWKS